MKFPWLAALRQLHPGKDRALFDAVSGGDRIGAQAWLDAGADPDKGFVRVRPGQVHLRQSSLLSAIARDNAPMVQMLLEAGANPEPVGSGMGLPMSAWLIRLVQSSFIKPEQKKIGLDLMLAGASLQKGLRAPEFPSLRGILEDAGKMATVDRVEMEALSKEMSNSLDTSTRPAMAIRRRPGL